MAYVVTESCIRCRYTDCVEVCPVDCFHAGPTMLVIDPALCIDCAVCEPACPIEAIKPGDHEEGRRWVTVNARFSEIWPSITEKSQPLEDAEAFVGVPGKFEAYMDQSLKQLSS